MPTPQVLGFQDAIEHCRNYLKGDASEAAQVACRRACISAYRELVQCRDWSYLKAQHTIELNASYSTGTVAFTASSRALTLTGGTWPSWAANGTVCIDNVTYEVYSRTSSSVITLEATNCPVADIASGETYVIYQNKYVLPSDFRRLYRPENEQNWWEMEYLPPQEFNRLDRLSSSGSDPQYYTLYGDPNNLGSQVLGLWPYPSTNKTLKFIYSKYPGDLKFSGQESASYTGTVSGTATDTAITGSGTGFLASHVGAFIRFSGNSTAVDGEAGLNPFIEQHIIASRSSTTAIVLDVALTNTLSASTFRITSVVDIAPWMIEAYLRGCERQLAIIRQLDGMANAEQNYRMALMQAFEADSNFESSRTAYNNQLPAPPSYRVTL